MDVLQGYDVKDSSSLHPKQNDFEQDINTDKKFKIGIIKSVIDEIEEPKIKEDFLKFIRAAREQGHELVELEPNREVLSSILVVYRTISSVEALSTNASMNGFLFGNYFGKEGNYDDKITKARTDGFTYEVKRRHLFGAEAVMNNAGLYREARKARTLIIEEVNKMFEQCDLLVNPATGKYPPLIEENNPLRYGSLVDDYLGIFNATGSPSITVPMNKDKE